jgi:hypothetical protein
VHRVHVSVDRPGVLGPPWIDAGADRGHGAPKLAGGGAKRRGERGELGSALTELGRRYGGRATVVQNGKAVALGGE